MRGHGIMASELIVLLQRLVSEHGDREVVAGGTDYPAGVQGAGFAEQGDAYQPPGTFYIY